MIKSKQIIFIDWNRTLSYNLFWEQLRSPSHQHNKHHQPITQWLFSDNKHLINPWMRGELTEDDVLTKMSDETGIDKEIIQESLTHSCKQMALCSTNIAPLIRELQAKGALVVIATDNMDVFRKYTVPALKLDELFDDILISSELGVLKDDKEPVGAISFFDKYLQDKGLSYKDAVLLDDSPDSSGKYKTLGFERVLIGSPEGLVVALEGLVVR